jgi:hypothetical protein
MKHLLTSLCFSLLFFCAQAQLDPIVIEQVHLTQTSGNSIMQYLDPSAVQRVVNSFEELHTRMETDLGTGSLSGTSDGMTVQSFMHSLGTLQIDGSTDLKAGLNVDGVTTMDATTMTGNLTQTGNHDLTGNSHMSGTLDVDGVSSLDKTDVDGQLTVVGPAATNYSDANVPAVSIELSGTETPHRNTNFIEFSSGDHKLGRVEGHNMAQEWEDIGDAFVELLLNGHPTMVGVSVGVSAGMSAISGALGANDDQAAYDNYTDTTVDDMTSAYQNALSTFSTDFGIGLLCGTTDLVKTIVKVITEIYGCYFVGSGCDDIVSALLQLLDDNTDLAMHVYGAYGWEGTVAGDGGIAFESVGADYAEWLEKDSYTESLFSGDIVGVRAGKVSKSFETAERFMVISTNPTVVGAMPNPSAEQNFARVAFMGQVPTKVSGIVQKGDFILPSGNNDGLAIGVSPQKMKTADYKRIIGTAWESNDGPSVSVINVAVGLNDNLLAAQVEELQNTLNKIESAVAKLDPSYEVSQPNLRDTKEYSVASTSKTSIRKQLETQAAALRKTKEENTEKKVAQLQSIFANAQQLALESGSDLTKLPYLAEVFADPLNVELREEALDFLKKRLVQLSSVQRTLKTHVQQKSKDGEIRGEKVETDHLFMLNPVNK